MKWKRLRYVSAVGIINEAVKGSSSEEEEMGICTCMIISRVDIINEEVKG